MRDYAELKALIEKRGVHAEFGEPGEGFAIEQNPHELATFLTRMQELGVQSVLEIGTGYKAGLAHFLALDMGWNVYSIDVQDYGHKKTVPHESVLFNVVKPGEFIRPYTDLDLVFIDGNHSYDSVVADYDYYGKFATKVIAFHDIAGLRDCAGVRKFWEHLTMTGYRGIKQSVEPPYFQVGDMISKDASGIGWIEL